MKKLYLLFTTATFFLLSIILCANASAVTTESYDIEITNCYGDTSSSFWDIGDTASFTITYDETANFYTNTETSGRDFIYTIENYTSDPTAYLLADVDISYDAALTAWLNTAIAATNPVGYDFIYGSSESNWMISVHDNMGFRMFNWNLDSSYGSAYIKTVSGTESGISYNITPAGNPVPAPSSMLLFGTGLAGLAGAVRFRKRQ